MLAAGIGLVASDIIPTPADALYFYLQRINREKFEAGKITSTQYWARDLAGYYLLNPAWWVLVVGVGLAVPGTTGTKAKIAIGLAGVGAVAGVIIRNAHEKRQAQ